MANAVYPKWKASIMSAVSGSSLNGSGATGVYCALVNVSTYGYSTAHQYWSELSGLVGTDQELTTQGSTKTFTAGTLKGDNLTWTSVAGGSTVSGFILYVKNAGADTTWQLVLYMDTSQSGLPITTNGGNISITFSGSGIFTLSDIRAKKDVVRIGNIGPLSLYEYSYTGKKERHVGFIAQDVERKIPSAVRTIDGFKRVDYATAIARA